MAYQFYLGELLLPVTPSSLKLKINNNNKELSLINYGDINVLKSPGLTEISFDILLPNSKYPFANVSDQQASYYLEQIEKLKTDLQPFQFIVYRTKPNGDYLFDTNIKVSLEDYEIDEDSEKYGMDVCVSINLKQYKDYGTKKLVISSTSTSSTSSSSGSSTTSKASVQASRTSNKTVAKTHTVASGESLWSICKKELGDGSKYTEIATLNGISNPNLISVGQVIKLG